MPLAVSHRLTKRSADYAKGLIRAGGWREDSLLNLWDGAGDGTEVDGSTFYLARTHRLLDGVRGDLMEHGTPFIELKGTAPFVSKEAEAFRVFTDLLEGRIVEAQAFRSAVERLENAALPRGVQDAVKRAAGALTLPTAEQLLEHTIGEVRSWLKHADYLQRVVALHGVRALYMTPKIALSTIHGAKGKEADHVKLISSWAYLPGRSLGTVEGQRAESCVSYVAASRHRVSLQLLHGEQGIPYPFP